MFLISFLRSPRYGICGDRTGYFRRISFQQKLNNLFTVLDSNTSLRAVNDQSVIAAPEDRSKETNRLETPLCTSASYTIEASIVLPLLICVMAMCIFFSQMVAVQWGISHALEETVKEAARIPDDLISSSEGEAGESGGEGGGADALSALSYGAFVFTCDQKIKETGVPTGFITGGLLGLNYSGTEIGEWEIKGKVSYYISLPLPLLGSHGASFTAESCARRWVGWNPAERDGDSGEYVYITPTGVAYHNDVHCVYLNPNMYGIAGSAVGDARNSSGSKYSACSVCKPNVAIIGTVYISDYGDVYHSTLACITLKRTIQRVTKDEAISDGYHSCPKCGG